MEKRRKNIYLTALVMIILEIFIKIIGFLKQSFTAYYYGANMNMDIYFVSSDFINGFSHAVINSVRLAVIGVYTSVRIKESAEKGLRIINELVEIILPVSFIIIIFFSVFAKQIGGIIAPSYDGIQMQQLTLYLRFLSGIILFTTLCMIFESILNSHEIYFVSKARSLIYSLCIILGCIFFSGKFGVSVLLFSQYLALIIYILIQLFFVKKYYNFSFVKIENISYITKIIFNAIPILVGNSVVLLNYMIDNAVSSFMEEGTVSALAYAHVLDDFFIGVAIGSVTLILFPHFTNLLAENNIEKVKKTLLDGMGMMIFILIPVSIFAFFSSENIVKIAFFRGEFKYNTLVLTSLALQGYVIRYACVAIRDIATQGIYANGNTVAPMFTAVISAIINAVISFCFWKKFGILAVTLGTTISACIGMFFNLAILRNSIDGLFLKPILKTLFKALLSSIICITAVLFYTSNFKISNVYINMAIIFIEIFIIYIVIMFLLRAEQINMIISYLKIHLVKNTH